MIHSGCSQALQSHLGDLTSGVLFCNGTSAAAPKSVVRPYFGISLFANQEPCPDGISLQNLRVLGSAAASSTGLELFKPPQLPEAAGNAQRSLRGSARGATAGAAAAGSGVPIVRAVDVYLAVHVEGMPQQVSTSDHCALHVNSSC